jgi:ubiquinone/menaquinone biosynthesis C-methylase UbiE/DNA-binding transcriptional ArsR family regulator
MMYSATAGAPPLLDQMAVLADPARSRVLWLLDRHALTVSELCAVVQLPQSTVSRHLKALVEAGWVSAHGEGTSNIYSVAREALDASARKLWAIVREQVGASAAAAQDQRRLGATLAAKRTRTQEFFSSSAGQWDRMRADLFGDACHLAAFGALADPAWTVGDLGCGTGHVAEALAPFVRRVIAVDGSAAMLAAARARVLDLPNVDLRRGELEALPIEDDHLDAALVMLVLHHLPVPELALAEAARALKPGGRIILVDMLPHDREAYRRQMGHVWLGFSDEQVRRLCDAAHLHDVTVVPLTPDPRTKGPALFAATARKRLADGPDMTGR